MQSAAIKMSQLYSVEALQKRASLLKWASCCLLCCAGAALLFAHFFADSMVANLSHKYRQWSLKNPACEPWTISASMSLIAKNHPKPMKK